MDNQQDKVLELSHAARRAMADGDAPCRGLEQRNQSKPKQRLLESRKARRHPPRRRIPIAVARTRQEQAPGDIVESGRGTAWSICGAQQSNCYAVAGGSLPASVPRR